MSTGSSMPGGQNFSISQDFVQSFVMQFSSSFGPAATQAGENISKIKEKISEINPDAPLVMQTIYNPFDANIDNEQLNSVMKPLKSFTAIYLGVINSAVKQQQAVIADIHTKLNENSWLYTNISDFDIHPNYLGHMLIAEEIIQQLQLSGNGDVFRNEIDKIPDDSYTVIPESITNEINALANGELRSGDLQASSNSYSAENETEAEVTEETSETAQKTTQTAENKTEQKKKFSISDLLLCVGVVLIVGSICLKIYSKKRKRT
jgi:hypothetical protein